MKNIYVFKDDYVIGYTHNTNHEFYIDIEDYDKIKDLCWSENDQHYIISWTLNRKKAIRLHRFILGLTSENELIIDHKNNNRYDNRKQNLRLANKQLNGINRDVNKNNLLGTKGVSLSKNKKKYEARIMINGKNIFLGSYLTLEEAKKTRQEAEIKYFGEFAYVK